MLKVRFISLVNLIADKEIVRELVADTMTVDNMKAELKAITSDEAYRQNMLAGYQEVNNQLGGAGAPNHAARIMIELLSRKE